MIHQIEILNGIRVGFSRADHGGSAITDPKLASEGLLFGRFSQEGIEIYLVDRVACSSGIGRMSWTAGIPPVVVISIYNLLTTAYPKMRIVVNLVIEDRSRILVGTCHINAIIIMMDLTVLNNTSGRGTPDSNAVGVCDVRYVHMTQYKCSFVIFNPLPGSLSLGVPGKDNWFICGSKGI